MKTFCCLLLCTVIASYAFAFDGIVTRVSDGDTVQVRDTSGAIHKIRLYGIDAPEKKQNFGSQATRALSELVLHKPVFIEVNDMDRYGRAVALVYAGHTLTNETLVEKGLAWVYPTYCKISMCSDWKDKEALARAAKKGLWQDNSAVPPWEFRKLSKK